MTWAVVIAAGVVVVVVGAEVYARVVLGLGNPPLWQADPEIEYLPRPNQDLVRFGKRVRYNRWSMRSGDFPAEKESESEVRVLVVGDSIVNGGVQTDQGALATELLERRLSAALGRVVRVGNVSAGSWGPPNYLAYLRRYGLFGADVVVVVVNSSDYADAPRFEGLGPGRPTRRPVLALEELVGKYVRLAVRRVWRRRTGYVREVREEDVSWCLRSLGELIGLARSAGAEVVVAQHLRRSELAGGPLEGHGLLGGASRAAGVEPVQLGPAFAEAISCGVEPYLDDMHPNEAGQGVLAGALYPVVLEALGRRGVAAEAGVGGGSGAVG